MKNLILFLVLAFTTTLAYTQQIPEKANTIVVTFPDSNNINGKKFRVNVKQYDMTELANSKGDTLSRPVYEIALKIFDSSDKLLFKDSVDVESWGYPGKIKRINEYQIAFPQLTNTGNEIVASFNVWEESSMDVILGRIAFDIVSNKANYSWAEGSMEE